MREDCVLATDPVSTPTGNDTAPPATEEPARATTEEPAQVTAEEPAGEGQPSGGGLRGRPLWRRVAGAWLPPLVALVAGWSLLAYRSPYQGARLFRPSSYGRWDTGHYLQIARYGYYATWHCAKRQLPPHLPPGHYLCGSIGWFPGYPAVTRGVSEVARLSLPVAGLAVAWLCWYLVLVLMWQLLRDARSVPARWVCLLIAAFFAGQVYFAALFPISLCIAGLLGCLYAALRGSGFRTAAVGFGSGVVAGASYLTAIVLCPALLVGALVARRRLRMVLLAAGVAAGLGAVLLAMQLSVGIWNAYFISARKYGLGAHSPLATLSARLQPLWTPQPPRQQFLRVTAGQTLLALCFVALATLVTLVRMALPAKAPAAAPALDAPDAEPGGDPPGGSAPLLDAPDAEPDGDPPGGSPPRRWWAAVTARVPAFELTFLLATIGVWLVPYIAGGGASTYRSEAFVVLSVPLLRRLPAWLLVVPLAATVIVAWRMAPYFFNGKLI